MLSSKNKYIFLFCLFNANQIAAAIEAKSDYDLQHLYLTAMISRNVFRSFSSM